MSGVNDNDIPHLRVQFEDGDAGPGHVSLVSKDAVPPLHLQVPHQLAVDSV